MNPGEKTEDWDFANADIHYMTHGLHPYPARMIPQIARRLIELYSSSRSIVLDPFCGSGGVLVEAILTNRDSFGIDINPLACLIARVKTTPLNPKILIQEWKRLESNIGEELRALRFREIDIETPDFSGTNLHYWFKPYMIKELALIKKHLDAVEDNKVREFFYVCFSNTVRSVSGVRKGEFKLYRMPKEEWEKYHPDVFEVFQKKVNECISKMGEFFEFVEKNKLNAKAEIFEANTAMLFTEEFPKEGREKLTEESVNLIVTSPPYGDSRTTVAYGEFSSLSLLWLGYPQEKVREIDKISLGGRLKDEDVDSRTLDEVLAKIRDEKRAKEVKSYFVELNEVIQKLYKVLKPNGYACFVLGNRTVNGVKIPTDEILKEIGKSAGLEHVKTMFRRIPSKRLPWKNSPTNIPGQKMETINKESIIVLQKIR